MKPFVWGMLVAGALASDAPGKGDKVNFGPQHNPWSGFAMDSRTQCTEAGCVWVQSAAGDSGTCDCSGDDPGLDSDQTASLEVARAAEAWLDRQPANAETRYRAALVAREAAAVLASLPRGSSTAHEAWTRVKAKADALTAPPRR